MFVGTKPGAIELTRTPRLPTSTAIDMVSWATPALQMAYGPMPAAGDSTAADAMLMMEPPPCSTITFPAA